MGTHGTLRNKLLLLITLLLPMCVFGQAIENGNVPSFGSVSTPRPINPATGTTNPSALDTQSLNPYLGSASDEKVIDEEIKMTLLDAVSRGLRFNLGLIDSQQSDAKARAQREHAFAALLPEISARAQQLYEQLSFKELGIKLPPQAGFQLPASSGAFGYSEGRISAQSSVLNLDLLNQYKQQKALVDASMLSVKDARDVVVLAVGLAYFQVLATQARLDANKAALTSAQHLNTQVADQYSSELSPEIDTLRAKVELHTAEQRVVDATNDLEKDKFTLDRVTGIPLEQKWVLVSEDKYAPLPDLEDESKHALNTRFDAASAQRAVVAAEFGVKAAHAERLPEISVEGNYGGGGANPANYNQVYEVAGTISIPLFTSGRIRSDVHTAEASLIERRSAYRDIQGRVDYDVRVAELDAKSSESAVRVAAENKTLAQRALAQSQDRYSNGVTNYLEVLQAQEATLAANENYIASLFSFNVAKLTIARSLGGAESRLPKLFSAQ